ncbi:MAG: hypothetical protein ACI4KR_12350, partial [Ruminiclostridium sp.]
RHLAKVEVASSSLVIRSKPSASAHIKPDYKSGFIFMYCCTLASLFCMILASPLLAGFFVAEIIGVVFVILTAIVIIVKKRK